MALLRWAGRAHPSDTGKDDHADGGDRDDPAAAGAALRGRCGRPAVVGRESLGAGAFTAHLAVTGCLPAASGRSAAGGPSSPLGVADAGQGAHQPGDDHGQSVDPLVTRPPIALARSSAANGIPTTASTSSGVDSPDAAVRKMISNSGEVAQSASGHAARFSASAMNAGHSTRPAADPAYDQRGISILQSALAGDSLSDEQVGDCQQHSVPACSAMSTRRRAHLTLERKLSERGLDGTVAHR